MVGLLVGGLFATSMTVAQMHPCPSVGSTTCKNGVKEKQSRHGVLIRPLKYRAVAEQAGTRSLGGLWVLSLWKYWLFLQCSHCSGLVHEFCD